MNGPNIVVKGWKARAKRQEQVTAQLAAAGFVDDALTAAILERVERGVQAMRGGLRHEERHLNRMVDHVAFPLAPNVDFWYTIYGGPLALTLPAARGAQSALVLIRNDLQRIGIHAEDAAMAPLAAAVEAAWDHGYDMVPDRISMDMQIPLYTDAPVRISFVRVPVAGKDVFDMCVDSTADVALAARIRANPAARARFYIQEGARQGTRLTMGLQRYYGADAREQVTRILDGNEPWVVCPFRNSTRPYNLSLDPHKPAHAALVETVRASPLADQFFICEGEYCLHLRDARCRSVSEGLFPIGCSFEEIEAVSTTHLYLLLKDAAAGQATLTFISCWGTLRLSDAYPARLHHVRLEYDNASRTAWRRKVAARHADDRQRTVALLPPGAALYV